MTGGPNLEKVLAEQANAAMAAGADPQATSERLERMLRHLRANPDLAQQGADALAQGADAGAVTGRVWELAQQPPKEKPGAISRAASQIGDFGRALIHEPVKTLGSFVTAPLKSAADAFLTPGVGEARPDPRLSKGGNSSGAPIPTGTYDAEHGAVTGKQRAIATGQTFANILFPAIAGKAAGGFSALGAGRGVANVGGLAAAGGVSGATYSPDDPAAGFVSGAVLTPTIAGAVRGAVKGARGVASSARDFAGRPAETGPLFKAGPVEIGEVEGLTDRAARENAEAFARRGVDVSQLVSEGMSAKKPVGAVDLAGKQGQRIARGLKTSSSSAEATMRGELEPRAEGAVDRVIQHGLETTGLVDRANGLQTVDDLIATREKNAQPLYEKAYEHGPISPDATRAFEQLMSTKEFRQAWQEARALARDQGVVLPKVRRVKAGANTSAIEADARMRHQAAMNKLTAEMKFNPNSPAAAEARQALAKANRTLHDATSAKYEFVETPDVRTVDYMKQVVDEVIKGKMKSGPGAGGISRKRGAMLIKKKNAFLAQIDAEAPAYGEARAKYSNDSDMLRAAELGRELWKMHPDEAAKAFRELSPGAQEIARRTGFDALSERIENGPQDVSKGTSKPRDVKRMRLLFPDDASFEKFRDGIRKEAQMLATNRAVLDGSVTADKLADIADMAGVELPDVFKAFKGNPLPLMAKAGKAMLSERLRSNADALAAERARQLTAGASGDAAARMEALQRIAKAGRKRAATGPGTFSALLAPKLTPADQRLGR